MQHIVKCGCCNEPMTIELEAPVDGFYDYKVVKGCSNHTVWRKMGQADLAELYAGEAKAKDVA